DVRHLAALHHLRDLVVDVVPVDDLDVDLDLRVLRVEVLDDALPELLAAVRRGRAVAVVGANELDRRRGDVRVAGTARTGRGRRRRCGGGRATRRAAAG